MVGEGAGGLHVDREGRSAAIHDGTGIGRGSGNGDGIDGHGLGNLVGAYTIARTHVEGHFIVASSGIGVAGVGFVAGLAIAKVPSVTTNLLSSWVGGRGAGKLYRGTFASGYVGEVGSRHGTHFDVFCLRATRFAAHTDGASVNASHLHGAVRDGGVLLIGEETVGTTPSEAGTRLVLCRQVDGLPHAIGTAAIHQGRQDATVGGAGTNVFKRDVARVV